MRMSPEMFDELKGLVTPERHLSETEEARVRELTLIAVQDAFSGVSSLISVVLELSGRIATLTEKISQLPK